MFIKQISVFLENIGGTLLTLTRLLKKNDIDVIAMSIAETEHYGILRLIVRDPERCAEIIRAEGFTARLTDVLAVCVPDQPGGLNDVLELFEKEKISIEYLYSFVRSADDRAVIIFYLDDLGRGNAVLDQAGIRLLDAERIASL